MHPVAISIVGGLLMMGFDRYRERRAAGASNLAPPRAFTAAEVARFTHPGPYGALRFDPPVAAGIREHLALRSVQPVAINAGPLGRNMQAWQIVPRAVGKLDADAFLANAEVGGATVLASLTMAMICLPACSLPMLFVVGDSNLAQLAGAGGHFAVMMPRPPVVAAAPAVEDEASPPVVSKAKRQKANGVHVPQSAATETDATSPQPGE